MKRIICAVVTGLALALVGSGTAAAGLPILGPALTGTQSASFGDQSVGKQRNDADVSQSQGNGNVNISPAISIGGDSSTENAQGNGNTAIAGVGQQNTATQTQSSDQKQASRDHSDACCGQSRPASQAAVGGAQDVGQQRNDADVSQSQGNGNVSISPAVALFGDATTRNSQGNGNTAVALVDQANRVDQSQSSTQSQPGGKSGWTDGCCSGQSQAGSQTTRFGDQSVGKQRNDADVTQSQGNGNVNISPAVAIGGDASTSNSQGNGNTAVAVVDQSNQADQSQTSSQSDQTPAGQPPHCAWNDSSSAFHPCRHPKCPPVHEVHPYRPDGKPRPQPTGSPNQTQSQSTTFGDQSVGKQRNDADVTQSQGNGNVNVSPALGLGGTSCNSCGSCGTSCSKCGGCTPHCFDSAGTASTRSSQGNGNTAVALVGQSNRADQSQTSAQKQGLVPWKGVTS